MNPFALAGLGALAAGAGVTAWAAVHPRAQLFGPALNRTRPDAIALTFDDGPNPATTPDLLRLLETHSARATFFLIGKHVRACPELAREIAERGHVVANHTETHPNLFWLGAARVRDELARAHDAITEATGRAPRWMRPPYGMRGPNLAGVVRSLGYRGVVLWSRIAWDWKALPNPRMAAEFRAVRGGDLLCMHDGAPESLGADRRHTVAALAEWLPRWRDAGLAFVTVDDAL